MTPSDLTGPMELDPLLNRFPAEIRHIHLMGICGTGMGALAGMLKDSGYQVSGSDDKVYPPMSDFLARIEIPVRAGYNAENLTPRPDLVVVGNVITRKNPEARALMAAGIPYCSFPQTLSHFFLNHKIPLVVTGTHGKTTTSSLLASLLHDAGLEPGFMIGGLVQEFGRNYQVGNGDYFVVEGDEYDTAFFDKGPKFLHYRPNLAIITSIEFDHADIYADLAAIKTSFRRLLAIMPEQGAIIACLDDPVVREVTAEATCPVIAYGLSPEFDWSLHDLEITPGLTTFSAYYQQQFFGRFSLAMPGRHNALNSLAVIAVLHRLGLPAEAIGRGLSRFQGVKRRQEVRGEVRGVTVIDDFAHHPTAVRETLQALRAAYGDRRLLAVFEPRTNSSRRTVFQNDYVTVFNEADQILVREPAPLNIPEAERFSCLRLIEDLRQQGKEAQYFPDTTGILDYLAANCKSGDVVAILSNGGFDNIHERLLRLLAAP